ncbi:MAG: osmoprotectant transport system substrate-binding protein [Ilumatobacteraceae bacterium]
MIKSSLRVLLAAAAAMLLLATACGSDSSTPSSSSSASGAAAGGATFTFTPLDTGGPLTKAALDKGDIQVGLLFSSDGAIAKNGWVALEDDKKLQPVDNFVPAVRKDLATADVVKVLDAVDAKLTKAEMQKAVAAVAIDGQNPEDVAKKFLTDNSLPGSTKATGTFVVGSANFAESEFAAQLYGQALKAAGATVTFKLDFGAREAYEPALASGELSLVPEFVGTLDTFLGGTASNDLTKTLAEAKTKAEAKGYTLTTPAPADSVNTFVVTKATADKYKLVKISDLASVSDPLKFGGPPECPTRPLCVGGLKSTYGLKFA